MTPTLSDLPFTPRLTTGDAPFVVDPGAPTLFDESSYEEDPTPDQPYIQPPPFFDGDSLKARKENLLGLYTGIPTISPAHPSIPPMASPIAYDLPTGWSLDPSLLDSPGDQDLLAQASELLQTSAQLQGVKGKGKAKAATPRTEEEILVITDQAQDLRDRLSDLEEAVNEGDEYQDQDGDDLMEWEEYEESVPQEDTYKVHSGDCDQGEEIVGEGDESPPLPPSWLADLSQAFVTLFTSKPLPTKPRPQLAVDKGHVPILQIVHQPHFTRKDKPFILHLMNDLSDTSNEAITALWLDPITSLCPVEGCDKSKPDFAHTFACYRESLSEGLWKTFEDHVVLTHRCPHPKCQAKRKPGKVFASAKEFGKHLYLVHVQSHVAAGERPCGSSYKMAELVRSSEWY